MLYTYEEAQPSPRSISYLPQYQRQLKRFSRYMTFTGHADASSVVYTLVDNSKLANQIATFLPIVVKLLIDLNKTNTALGCRGKLNIDVMKKKLIYRSFSHAYGEIIRPLTITKCTAKPEIANQCFTISVRKFLEGTSITDLNK